MRNTMFGRFSKIRTKKVHGFMARGIQIQSQNFTTYPELPYHYQSH